MHQERQRHLASTVVLHYDTIRHGPRVQFRFMVRGRECRLTPGEFHLLNQLVTDAPSLKVLAVRSGIGGQSVKNTMNTLYRKFGIRGNTAMKKVILIRDLVVSGVLEYQPRVRS